MHYFLEHYHLPNVLNNKNQNLSRFNSCTSCLKNNFKEYHVQVEQNIRYKYKHTWKDERSGEEHASASLLHS